MAIRIFLRLLGIRDFLICNFSLLKLNAELQINKWKGKKNDVVVIISTTKTYAVKTIPDLIKGLIHSGVSENDIVVFEGGWDVGEKVYSGSVPVYHCNHNSFDYTALIGILEIRSNRKFCFLLHDTSEIYSDRFSDVLYYSSLKDDECRSLKEHPSMNIGFYPIRELAQQATTLKELTNRDYSESGLQKFKKTAVEKEDSIFLEIRNKPLVKKFNPVELLVNYGVSERICETYPYAGLKKFKANNKRSDYYEIGV